MGETHTPVSIFIFASTETREGNARVVNGLMTAKEILEADGDVEVVFDGVGVVSAVEFADSDHRLHRLYKQVQDRVTGVCKFCARSFDVLEQAEELGIPLVDEYKQHPSIYKRVQAGKYILTF